jgi:hypothetical protein
MRSRGRLARAISVQLRSLLQVRAQINWSDEHDFGNDAFNAPRNPEPI